MYRSDIGANTSTPLSPNPRANVSHDRNDRTIATVGMRVNIDKNTSEIIHKVSST